MDEKWLIHVDSVFSVKRKCSDTSFERQKVGLLKWVSSLTDNDLTCQHTVRLEIHFGPFIEYLFWTYTKPIVVRHLLYLQFQSFPSELQDDLQQCIYFRFQYLDHFESSLHELNENSWP